MHLPSRIFSAGRSADDGVSEGGGHDRGGAEPVPGPRRRLRGGRHLHLPGPPPIPRSAAASHTLGARNALPSVIEPCITSSRSAACATLPTVEAAEDKHSAELAHCLAARGPSRSLVSYCIKAEGEAGRRAGAHSAAGHLASGNLAVGGRHPVTAECCCWTGGSPPSPPHSPGPAPYVPSFLPTQQANVHPRTPE